MEKTKARYRIRFYDLDTPIAANYTGCWPAHLSDGIIMNSSKDDACLLNATVLEINHPKLGSIKGIYTFGLDYKIILTNGSELTMNAEETPGLIYEKNEILDEDFDIVLWNPVLTEVPYKYAFAGLDTAERKLIWERRKNNLAQKLKIKI